MLGFIRIIKLLSVFFKMITALPVPSVKVFHKTYYQEKGSRIANSQPGSPLAESEAVLALVDKEPPEYYFCGKVKSNFLINRSVRNINSYINNHKR